MSDQRAPEKQRGASTDARTPRILVFFDYACQFCYLDWPRLKRLRQQHGAELFLVPFELRPGLDPAGVSIEELGGAHSEHIEEHMRRMAREGGLPLVFPDFVPNTHLALALGEHARDLGPDVHERVHEAIFEAYSGHALDIGKLDVLLDLAEREGLDRADVQAALTSGRYDERLHQFRHFALALGITATPAALVCNELFIGTRPYQVLADALERCLVDAAAIAERGGEEAGASSAEAVGEQSETGAGDAERAPSGRHR